MQCGYFITPYLPTADVKAQWEGIWEKFKQYVDSENRLVIKYRITEPLKGANNEDVLQSEGTWVNTTSFTSAVPTGVAIGDEVEVMAGDNAGCSIKISTLSATPNGSDVITVTLAEAVPTNSTDAALFRFDNWKEVESISDSAIGSKKSIFGESAQGEFIQLKVELRGHGVEIDELIPILKSLTSPKQA